MHIDRSRRRRRCRYVHGVLRGPGRSRVFPEAPGVPVEHVNETEADPILRLPRQKGAMACDTRNPGCGPSAAPAPAIARPDAAERA